MTTRTSRKIVSFRRPFTVSGLDGIQPPGDYAVVTDEEEIATVLSSGWRRVLTSLQIPSIDRNTGQQQMYAISADDLLQALEKDGASGNPG